MLNSKLNVCVGVFFMYCEQLQKWRTAQVRDALKLGNACYFCPTPAQRHLGIRPWRRRTANCDLSSALLPNKNILFPYA